MRRITPEWYAPIAFVVVLFVSANHVLPQTINSILMLAVAISQSVMLGMRLRQRMRIGQVTYGRGVRYETPARGLNMQMLRAEWVHIAIAVLALMLGLAMW